MDPATAAAVAKSFADSLDDEEYARARSILDDQCEYEFRGETIIGADRIIEMYREAGESAQVSFESIRYESSVTPMDGGEHRIRFIDTIGHAGDEHVHECEQIVRLDSQNRIVRIRHIDLPGQREALQRFRERHGIG